MLFVAEWIMFQVPTDFLSSRGKKINLTEIKSIVGQKINDWPKFNYFTVFSGISHLGPYPLYTIRSDQDI